MFNLVKIIEGFITPRGGTDDTIIGNQDDALKIVQSGVQDLNNTTTTPLSSGDTYTGTGTLNTYSDVLLACRTDQAGIIYMELSSDGINWDTSVIFEVTANVDNVHKIIKGPRYYRTRFLNNSGSNQTFLRLYTYYGNFNVPTSPLSTTVNENADAIVTRSVPFEIEASNNRYEGFQYINKFGSNPDIDSGTTQEDIWSGGGLYTGFPDGAAETIEIFSSSNDDTLSGSNARTVLIEGLDANGNVQSEEIDLAGTSSSFSVNTYTRVNRLIVTESGNNNTTFNAGTITARHSTTTANIFGVIPVGLNQSRIACYTVPFGFDAVLRNYFVSLDKKSNAVVTVGIYVREQNKAPRIIQNISASNNAPFNSGPINGIRFDPLTDISLRKLDSNSNNIEVFGEFDLVLIKRND